MAENKVSFGIQNLHIGTYEVADGTIKLGEPIKQPGARSLSLDPEVVENKIDADNVTYWSTSTNNGFSGSLEVVKYIEKVKVAFFGYKKTADGGMATLKAVQKPNVYVAFEASGDVEPVRVILLNVSLGDPKVEYKTSEDGKAEIAVEVSEIKVIGDNESKITRIAYHPDDEGFKTVFTKPTIPTIAEAE